MIIPDNATTASNQITAGDRARDVNATYEAFLAWYNTAADPTRSRKPRDKGAVEAGVKVITRSVIAVLQGSTFVDLDEINERIDELIDEINCVLSTFCLPKERGKPGHLSGFSGHVSVRSSGRA